MNPKLEKMLIDWPLPVIRDVDLAATLGDGSSKRYAMVNRALKKGILVHLRQGVYLIGKPYGKNVPSKFQIAHSLYGPSYISFESALSYHQWIPEAVYTTACATANRAKEFDTPIGLFQYIHVPNRLFYLGVERVGNDDEAFFIANPWKALADHYYVHTREWHSVEDLYSDMRIESEEIRTSDLAMLRLLAEHYQSSKVRKFLSKILRSLTKWK